MPLPERRRCMRPALGGASNELHAAHFKVQHNMPLQAFAGCPFGFGSKAAPRHCESLGCGRRRWRSWMALLTRPGVGLNSARRSNSGDCLRPTPQRMRCSRGSLLLLDLLRSMRAPGHRSPPGTPSRRRPCTCSTRRAGRRSRRRRPLRPSRRGRRSRSCRR